MKFEHYKKIKTFSDTGCVTFKYLMALKLLTYSPEQFNEFKQAAIKELQEKKIPAGKTFDSEVRVRACEICLADYFQILINLKLELENEIIKGYENLDD